MRLGYGLGSWKCGLGYCGLLVGDLLPSGTREARLQFTRQSFLLNGSCGIDDLGYWGLDHEYSANRRVSVLAKCFGKKGVRITSVSKITGT